MITARAVFALRVVALVLGAVVTLAALAAVRADSRPPTRQPIVVQFQPLAPGSLT